MKKFIKGNTMLLLFLTSAMIVIVISLYSGSLMVSATRMIEYNTEQRLLIASKTAAMIVTGEELNEFITVEDMEKPLYEEIRERMYDFAVEFDLVFIYYMRPAGDDMLQFIIDNDYDPETQVSLKTDPIPNEEAPLKALDGIASASGLGSYSQGWDGLLTAYAPVYDTNGNVIAIAGVDITDEQIIYTKTSMEILIMVLIICLIIVIISGILGFNLYKNKALQSESANIAKSQFLSRMSHEIRTPMNAIIGLCRMARNSDDINEIKTHLTNISASSKHLLGLINDVLDISKIESGKMGLSEIPISLKDEIDEICKIVIPQINFKEQQFHINMSSDLPNYVYVDNTHLRQIVINLLSNAIKFTDKKGHISLDIKLIESKENVYNLKWKVTDTGIGIHPEHIDKLFAPFEQGDGSTTRKYGGTGLGLSISKQLIEMMNGEIHVESVLGEGSSFIFNIWLKAVSDEEIISSKKTESKEKININYSEKYFLLVEDSEINQMIAEDVFANLGAKIDIADNGLEGLKKYTENPEKYDMIFMDIQMPVMDGYESTRSIRTSDTPGADKIPIIAMTANVFNEDIIKAREAGMNAHIGKPFEPEQIEQVIINVMEGMYE